VNSFEDSIILKEGSILGDLGVTSLVIMAKGDQLSIPVLHTHPLLFVAICDKVEEKKQQERKQATTIKPSRFLILCNIQMPATFRRRQQMQ
jgi:hypothetical protein